MLIMQCSVSEDRGREISGWDERAFGGRHGITVTMTEKGACARPTGLEWDRSWMIVMKVD